MITHPHNPGISPWGPALLIGAILVAAPCLCAAGDPYLEDAESRIALQAAMEKAVAAQEELELVKKSVSMLGESLAEANREANHYREAYTEIRRAVEALGISAVSSKRGTLEQRLLKAVSDYDLAEKEKAGIAEQLSLLIEAVVGYMRTAVNSDPESRLNVESRIRACYRLLGSGSSTPAVAGEEPLETTREDLQVISFKKELGLIVCNAGSRAGMRIGTPLQILRKDRPVGAALVVDVRDHISGALVRSMISEDESVKLGDIVQVTTTSNQL